MCRSYTLASTSLCNLKSRDFAVLANRLGFDWLLAEELAHMFERDA